MKKFISLILVVISSGFIASCKFSPEAKILLVGDSWAALMCYDSTFDQILSRKGLSDKYRTECLTTTQIGTHAEGWADPGNLKKITTALSIDTKVEYVILSMGGNDIFQYWNRNLNPVQEAAIFEKIGSWIRTVVKHIQDIKPEAKIIITGYDYPNFEVLNSSIMYEAYRQRYQEMGSPTPYELNLSLQKHTSMLKQIGKDMNVVVVDNTGLMQYHYGQSDFNIPPHVVPLPGGDPRVPGPKEAMLEIPSLNFVDAFHLDREAFDIIGTRIYDQYIKLQ